MKKGQMDFYFLIIVLSLLAFGLVMLFSASSEWAREYDNDAYFYVKKQGIFAILGIVVMFVLANINYKLYEKFVLLILGGVVMLNVAVLFIGQTVKGGQRWINLGFTSFQPSELAKFALVIFFAFSLARNKDKLGKFWSGLVPYLIMLGLFAGLVLMQKHVSGTVIVVMIGIVMLFVAGAKWWHLGGLGMLGAVGGFMLVFFDEVRWKRVVSFTDPFADKLADGYQAVQSLYAIGSGGIFGVGLGRSRQKFLYMPEPHNDFIFAVLCEELGLIGAMIVILLFIALIWRGILIAMKAQDTFGSLVVVGVIATIAVQVLLNIAVVTSSMPVTGVSLPFFSYGGTSLLIIMAEIGIVLNISRYTSR